MEGLEAIDEQLEALAEDKDVDEIIAKAHDELPDRSESFEMIDAMLANLGEAVNVPTVAPVGIEIPKPALPEIRVPAPADEPDTAVQPSAPTAEAEGAEADIPETREHQAPPKSAADMAAEADAAVDALAEGTDSGSGLDADDLFGDLDPDSQMTPTEDVVDVSDPLAQVRAMTSEAPPADTAEAAPEAQPPAAVAESVAEGAEPEAPTEGPRTEPPPPPAQAGDRESIEEIDLDEIIIDEDDSFELMIDEDEAADTFVGDADAVENAQAEAEQSAQPPPPLPESDGEGQGEGEGAGDDPREQSFFKKIFG